LGQEASTTASEPAYVVRADETVFTVERTISVPADPHGVAFSPDGALAYVACAGDDVVAVIDLDEGRLLRTIPAGSTPLDVFLTPQGDSLIATQFRSDALTRVPLDGSGPRTRIDVALSPSLFTREVKGRRYVVCEFGDRVFELDAQGAPTRSWETARQPYPADLTSDGVLLFVPAKADNALTVVDTLNDRVVTTVEVGKAPEGAAVTADDVHCVVACSGSNELCYVNTASFEVVHRVREGVGPRPFGVTMTTDGRYALVNNADGDSVSILDVEAKKIVGALQVGDKPIVVRAHPDGLRLLVSCEGDDTVAVVRMRRSRRDSPDKGPTEVAVLGMIHSGHTTSERYPVETIRAFLRAYRPDYVLTEIPPNRFDAALAQWRTKGAIDEPRVRVFPEYTDAVFPLMDELGYTIVPTAGWTAQMNDYRSRRLREIAQDPAFAQQLAEHKRAMEAMRRRIAALGPADDPFVIHSPEYDAAIDAGYGGPYNRYFNDELADGGWDNINAKHWANIERFLDSVSGQGARVLITFGAAHKGWFLRKLRERGDVQLVDPRTIFAQLRTAAAQEEQPAERP